MVDVKVYPVAFVLVMILGTTGIFTYTGLSDNATHKEILSLMQSSPELDVFVIRYSPNDRVDVVQRDPTGNCLYIKIRIDDDDDVKIYCDNRIAYQAKLYTRYERVYKGTFILDNDRKVTKTKVLIMNNTEFDCSYIDYVTEIIGNYTNKNGTISYIYNTTQNLINKTCKDDHIEIQRYTEWYKDSGFKRQGSSMNIDSRYIIKDGSVKLNYNVTSLHTKKNYLMLCFSRFNDSAIKFDGIEEYKIEEVKGRKCYFYGDKSGDLFIDPVWNGTQYIGIWQDYPNLNDKLIAYYNANEASGELKDSLGIRNMTETGGSTGSSYGIINNSRGVYNGNVFTYTNFYDFKETNNFSISYWARANTANPSNEVMLTNDHSAGTFFFAYYTNAGSIAFQIGKNGGTLNQCTYSGGVVSGTWYHIVGTFNTTHVSCYVNNVSITPVAYTAGATSAANNFRIGNQAGSTASNDQEADSWVFDEIAFYNRTLNSTEISQLYNYGYGLTYNNTPIVTNPITLNSINVTARYINNYDTIDIIFSDANNITCIADFNNSDNISYTMYVNEININNKITIINSSNSNFDAWVVSGTAYTKTEVGGGNEGLEAFGYYELYNWTYLELPYYFHVNGYESYLNVSIQGYNFSSNTLVELYKKDVYGATGLETSGNLSFNISFIIPDFLNTTTDKYRYYIYFNAYDSWSGSCADFCDILNLYENNRSFLFKSINFLDNTDFNLLDNISCVSTAYNETYNLTATRNVTVYSRPSPVGIIYPNEDTPFIYIGNITLIQYTNITTYPDNDLLYFNLTLLNRTSHFVANIASGITDLNYSWNVSRNTTLQDNYVLRIEAIMTNDILTNTTPFSTKLRQPSFHEILPINGTRYNFSQVIEISVNTSNLFSDINNVWANISYPNSTTVLLDLVKDGTTIKWNNTFTTHPNIGGTYNITIYSNDTFSSYNVSTTWFYTLYDYSNISVNQSIITVGQSLNLSWLINTSATYSGEKIDIFQPNGSLYDTLYYTAFSKIYDRFINGNLLSDFEINNVWNDYYGNSISWQDIPSKYYGIYGGNTSKLNHVIEYSYIYLQSQTAGVRTYFFRFRADNCENSVGATTLEIWTTTGVILSGVKIETSCNMSFVKGGTGTYVNITKIEQGKWYNVTTVFNMDNGTIDYYIDNRYNTTTTYSPYSADLRAIVVDFITVNDNLLSLDDFFYCEGQELFCGLPVEQQGVWKAQLNYTTVSGEILLNTTFWVLDTLYPSFSSIMPENNSRFNITNEINISVNVTHLSGIDTVYFNITYPDNTREQQNITNETGNLYYYDFTVPDINGTYTILFWANTTLGHINSTSIVFRVGQMNYTFTLNKSILYNLNYTPIIAQIKYTTGNYTWNTTQYNITPFNITNWQFQFTNYGNVPNLIQFKLNKTETYKEWWCYNTVNISSEMTNITTVQPGNTVQFNCTLNVINCSQTYVNWIKTVDNCNLSIQYAYNISDTGG